jgi:cellulose synthase/poly-beta-1,6-N-acetylglucosamine synthase-like glycosyltransferase
VSGARFALFFTSAAWLAYVTEQILRLADSEIGPRTIIETGVYLVIVSLLTASACAYLLARLGYFERIRVHQRVPRSSIDDCLARTMPTVTVLIPSYREDERVIRQTLMSAALQEYPNLRVVLLVDDPPNPSEPEARRSLERTRWLPDEISALLREPRQRFERAFAAFKSTADEERAIERHELATLATEYEAASAWFADTARTYPRQDHSDEFLVIEVFQRMANDLHTTANALHAAASERDMTLSRRRAGQLYARLMRIFQAEILSFERKQFASLSHEPNKAMNLNSYLGLMGGSYCIVPSPGGRVLLPADGREPDLVIPASDYVLTLDADSILLPEYCLRLAYFMEQPENDDVAVAQTPYSSYLGAPSTIERIAGATTDIQHIVHQGLTHYEATFWVGANALIRKRALDQLEECQSESGFTIKRYIKDRTVIEDTESSIDLRARGWRLYNYPERLSYSATPPDFGALVIQRQRWANGGLVILPKLIKLLRKREPGVPRPGWAELFLRTNYLASISWASLGLLLLLFYPFDARLLTRFGAITAVPYFWTMSSDLRREGYSRMDVLRIYGFNLLLLPVNLMGTVQSIVQSIGGQKIAFARTPKVANRTVAPLTYVLVPLLLVAWSAHTLGNDWDKRAYIHGGFAALNATMAAYACIALIGLHNIVVDVFMNLRSFVYRPVKPRPASAELPYWASVLYVGGAVPEEIERNAPLAVALAAEDRFGVMDRPRHHTESPGRATHAGLSVTHVEPGVAQ